MNTAEIIKILEDNKITNVGKNTPYNNMEKEAMEISRQQSKKNKEEQTHSEEDFYTKMLEEKELLDMGLRDSIRQKEERTPSEEMQDKLEPIPCPMHEDYDDEKTNV